MGRVDAILNSMGGSSWVRAKNIPQGGKLVLRPVSFRAPAEWPKEVMNEDVIVDERNDPKWPVLVNQIIHWLDVGDKRTRYRCRKLYYQKLSKAKGKLYQCPFCQVHQALEAANESKAAADIRPSLEGMMNVIDEENTAKIFGFSQATILRPILQLLEDVGNIGSRKHGYPLILRRTNDKKYAVNQGRPGPLEEYSGEVKNLVSVALETEAVTIAEGRQLLIDNYQADNIDGLDW